MPARRCCGGDAVKFIPSEPPVKLYEEGFEADDVLGRAAVGQDLSDLVERIEDPIVIALESGWGMGKTYFLKRWVGAHTLQNKGKATTVYFDAFAHDYQTDPLPALVSALTDRCKEVDEGIVKKLKTATFQFIKPVARIGLATATSGVSEAVGAVAGAATNALGAEASQYWKQQEGRHAAMTEFRSALEGIVKETGAGVVIVVDELDRCRPDYALEVLEVIKHFFAISGVTFVLGTNLSALESSVKASYGADIDASAYLRKFIDVSLALPSALKYMHHEEDTVQIYLKHQMVEMGIPKDLARKLRTTP